MGTSSKYGRVLLLILVVAVALALASCGGSGGAGGGMEGMGHGGREQAAKKTEGKEGMQGMDHGEMNHGLADIASEMVMENGKYSDKAFIDAMVPHHQGAIDMA